MTTNPISPKEKKLRNLRKILWIVFSPSRSPSCW